MRLKTISVGNQKAVLSIDRQGDEVEIKLVDPSLSTIENIKGKGLSFKDDKLTCKCKVTEYTEKILLFTSLLRDVLSKSKKLKKIVKEVIDEKSNDSSDRNTVDKARNDSSNRTKSDKRDKED